MTKKLKKKVGFALMDPDKQRELARKGGASIPADKRSFSQDRELAARAGSIGGSILRKETRSFSINNELAREAGRKGGHETQRRIRELRAKQDLTEYVFNKQPDEPEGRDE